MRWMILTVSAFAFVAGCQSARGPEVAPDGHQVVLRKPPGSSPRTPRAAKRMHLTPEGKLLPEAHR